MKTTLVSLALLASLTTACGKSDRSGETPAPSASPMGSDAGAATEALAANMDDAMESVADKQESSGTALALAIPFGSNQVDRKSDFTRECVVDGNNAKVTIKAEFDRSFDKTRGQVTLSKTMHWLTERTRVWSREKDGQAVAVACGPENKFAKIDWNDVGGLKLDVEFKHERTHAFSFTNNKKDTGKSQSRVISAKGKRHIAWGDVDASSDATLEIRNKTVTSEAERSLKVTKMDGREVRMELKVVTDPEAPLAIAVARKKADMSLVWKTIKSGKLIATRAGDGRVESVFANFKVGLSEGKCTLMGGTVETSVFAEGATEAARQYRLEVLDGGDYKVTDLKTGEAVSDFELNECDPADFAE